LADSGWLIQKNDEYLLLRENCFAEYVKQFYFFPINISWCI